MTLVMLDADGRLQVPREELEKLGLKSGDYVKIEMTEEGSLSVVPVSDYYEVELYSDERVREFKEANELTPELRERLKHLKDR
jgi:bifunctional DNA-binding transcriptional regulator/antitoxin component of YhaV-PrlF toxin-antitoxin module